MEKKKIFTLIFLILMIIFISVTFLFISPAEIVKLIGIENSYLFLGIVAFLGGISLLIPFPYYVITFSLGAAGLNPFLLGLFAGMGTLLGDTTSYYLAYFGKKVLTKKEPEFLKRIFNFTSKKNPIKFLIFAFLYACFIPLPDDLFMIPAGMIRYPFKRLAIAMGLGKIVLNTFIAFAGFYGWNILVT